MRHYSGTLINSVISAGFRMGYPLLIVKAFNYLAGHVCIRLIGNYLFRTLIEEMLQLSLHNVPLFVNK